MLFKRIQNNLKMIQEVEIRETVYGKMQSCLTIAFTSFISITLLKTCQDRNIVNTSTTIAN